MIGTGIAIHPLAETRSRPRRSDCAGEFAVDGPPLRIPDGARWAIASRSLVPSLRCIAERIRVPPTNWIGWLGRPNEAGCGFDHSVASTLDVHKGQALKDVHAALLRHTEHTAGKQRRGCGAGHPFVDAPNMDRKPDADNTWRPREALEEVVPTMVAGADAILPLARWAGAVAARSELASRLWESMSLSTQNRPISLLAASGAVASRNASSSP